MRVVIIRSWQQYRIAPSFIAGLCLIASTLAVGAADRNGSWRGVGVERQPFISGPAVSSAVDLLPMVFDARSGEREPLFAPGRDKLPPDLDPLPPRRPTARDLDVAVTQPEPVPISPLPAALPLFVTGIAVLGVLAWLRPPSGEMHANDGLGRCST